MQKNISEHDTLNLKEDRQKTTQGAAPVSKPLRNVSSPFFNLCNKELRFF